jgi:hypothetical protein
MLSLIFAYLSTLSLVAAFPATTSTIDSAHADIPVNANGHLVIKHANGQGWCMKSSSIRLCDTPTSFSIYKGDLTYKADKGF